MKFQANKVRFLTGKWSLFPDWFLIDGFVIPSDMVHSIQVSLRVREVYASVSERRYFLLPAI
jgi:hypothetical protein